MQKLVKKGYTISKYFVFPLILALFPLLKVTRGIDLTDAAYSLGNYVFLDGKTGVWYFLTFISNIVGRFFTCLPMGNTLIGMKVYSGLIVSVMALFGYRFFMTKMPAWLAFLSEVAAIGMCWAPTVILYNYLTYLLLLIAAVLIFRGLAGTNRTICLFIAGILLGINTFVRFPNNGLEVLLIFALWFYAIIRNMDFADVFKQTMLCVLGYAVGFGVILLIISISYGSGTFGYMLSGVFGISKSASDYTFFAMVISILDAYWHGIKWAFYLILCVLPGVPFFALYRGKFEKSRKVIYCLCIVFLFFVLYKWGMFNFKYYQKEAALSLGAIVLLISIASDIYVLFSKHFNHDWKLIAILSMIIVLITPLGSNNHIWPVLNNMFFIFPVTAWIVYRFVRWGRQYLDITGKVPLFAPKAMIASTLIMFFIQAVGIGIGYTFIDGEDGSKLNQYITGNIVLAGTKTETVKATALSQISTFMDSDPKYTGKKLILYGNIPGLSYYLNKPTALNTSWSDLDSNPVDDMEEALKALDGSDINNRPLVILSRSIYDIPDNSIKLNMINDYMDKNDYKEVFNNELFVVFE